jgi:hypothetical protein
MSMVLTSFKVCMGKSRTYSSIASTVVNTEDNNKKENIRPRGEFNEDETDMESTIATTPFKAKNHTAPQPVSRSASATQIWGLQSPQQTDQVRHDFLCTFLQGQTSNLSYIHRWTWLSTCKQSQR